MESVGKIPVEALLLDPINPRLPERVQNSSQDELLAYLYDHDVLDELAASFVANGYFSNEPLLVLPPQHDGRRIVVEGNRRASALMILLQTDAARLANIEFRFEHPVSRAALAELTSVHCMQVRDREELGTYLGYRHIGGIRPWPAESKARWIHANVAMSAAAGVVDPFYEVGRRFGSNSRGVRTSYVALEVLRLASDEFGVDTAQVQRSRYSVWGLLISNSNVQRYLRYDKSARTFQEVNVAVRDIDGDRLREVLGDLVPKDGDKTAVLSDSRQVSQYALVLADDRARQALRDFRDLDLAVSILEQGSLALRLRDVQRALQVLLPDAARLDVTAEALDVAEDVSNLATGIVSVIRGRNANS